MFRNLFRKKNEEQTVEKKKLDKLDKKNITNKKKNSSSSSFSSSDDLSLNKDEKEILEMGHKKKEKNNLDHLNDNLKILKSGIETQRLLLINEKKKIIHRSSSNLEGSDDDLEIGKQKKLDPDMEEAIKLSLETYKKEKKNNTNNNSSSSSHSEGSDIKHKKNKEKKNNIDYLDNDPEIKKAIKLSLEEEKKALVRKNDEELFLENALFLIKELEKKEQENKNPEKKQNLFSFYTSTQDNEDSDDEIPEEYKCPITFELMGDPTYCSLDGSTFERKAIEDALKKYGKSPLNNKEISGKDINKVLSKNEKIAEGIAIFLKENPEYLKYWYKLERHDLALMSDLPGHDINQAKTNKIYLSEAGDYIFCDPKGNVQQGQINDEKIDMQNLKNKLEDKLFKASIVEIILKAVTPSETQQKKNLFN